MRGPSVPWLTVCPTKSPMPVAPPGATEVPPPQIQQGAALIRSRLLQPRGVAAGLGREREHHSPPWGAQQHKA